GAVVVVVEVVVVVAVVVVEVVVVTGHVGSVGSPVQVQRSALHCEISDFLQVLRSLPDKPAHPASISSAHGFAPQIGGAAFAPVTETPAQSATATTVTTAFLVIVEPPMAVPSPSPRSISTALRCVPVFDPPVKTKSVAGMPALRPHR